VVDPGLWNDEARGSKVGTEDGTVIYRHAQSGQSGRGHWQARDDGGNAAGTEQAMKAGIAGERWKMWESWELESLEPDQRGATMESRVAVQPGKRVRPRGRLMLSIHARVAANESRGFFLLGLGATASGHGRAGRVVEG